MNTKHGGFTYILTNERNTVLYVGVTTALRARIWQHKSKFYSKSFTAKYNCEKIVWFEPHDTIMGAIKREKQLKAGNRKRKLELVNSTNPEWKDLWEDIQEL